MLNSREAKKALGVCDRCSRVYRRNELREEERNRRRTNIFTCRECFEKENPQIDIGRYPVRDAQAIRKPRPDFYDGNRDIQWGWNPVGYFDKFNLYGDTNRLVATGEIGTVTVTTS